MGVIRSSGTCQSAEGSRSRAWPWSARLGSEPLAAVGGRTGPRSAGRGGGHDLQRRQQVAGAPDHQQRGPRGRRFLGGRGPGPSCPPPRRLSALWMLLDVAAEDEGVSGLEQGTLRS